MELVVFLVEHTVLRLGSCVGYGDKVFNDHQATKLQDSSTHMLSYALWNIYPTFTINLYDKCR